MQINVRLSENFPEYAQRLRASFFGPSATAKEYRDSFVFSYAIEAFNAAPAVLRQYLDFEEDLKNQRYITIRQNSYEKLKLLAKTLNCSIPSVFRAIVIYSAFNKVSEATSSTQLEAKIALLEQQLSDCQETISQIKKLLQS